MLIVVGGIAQFWGQSAALALLRTRRVIAHDVWYYDASLGPSSLLILMLWLLLLTPITEWLLRCKEPERLLHDNLRKIYDASHGSRLTRGFYRRVLSPLKGTPLETQIDFVLHLGTHSVKKPVIVLSVITAVFVVLDWRSYRLLDRSGLESTHYWTSQVRHYSWAELKRVEVGCWVRSKNELSIRYSLIFGDNVAVNLFDRLPDQNAVAIAERVESLRVSAHVPKVLAHFTSGIHAGERFAHPSCPEAMTAHYGEEGMWPFYMLLSPDE